MKKTPTYTQCKLQKGYTFRVVWIPTLFARPNRMIDLKIDGKWSDGWRVVFVGAIASSEYVETHEADYRKQREASDI